MFVLYEKFLCGRQMEFSPQKYKTPHLVSEMWCFALTVSYELEAARDTERSIKWGSDSHLVCAV